LKVSVTYILMLLMMISCSNFSILYLVDGYMRKHTYFCQSIYPLWNWFPSQLVTNILAEMVAILNNQVICITMIARSMPLHEFSNLNGVQACGPNEYGPPELEAWALPRLDLKNTTCWVVMGSKCIFYSMNCTTVEGGR